jgi:hypothetical protein
MNTPPPPPVYTTPNIEILETYRERRPSNWSNSFVAITTDYRWIGSLTASELIIADSTMTAESSDSLTSELKMSTEIKEKANKLGFPIPEYHTVIGAVEVTKILKNLNSDLKSIFPTEDGGVLVEFSFNDVYHMIDIYDDGDTIFAKGGEDKVIESITRNFKNELESRLV